MQCWQARGRVKEALVPDDNTTNWTIAVSKDTDSTVRAFLAQHGMGSRDLLKFIEEAVK